MCGEKNTKMAKSRSYRKIRNQQANQGEKNNAK